MAEQSIKDQIDTMLALTIEEKGKNKVENKLRKAVGFGDYTEAKKLLRDINTLGKKLEYRGSGLKILPPLAETKELKLKITQARAAAQTALTSITHFEGVQIDIEKLKKAIEHDENSLKTAPIVTDRFKATLEARKKDFAGKEKKANDYKRDAEENISILTEVLKEAKKIVDREPWLDSQVLSKPENKKGLVMFLKREGFYVDLNSEFFLFLSIINRIDFRQINLEKVNLKNADLRKANFEGAIFKEADLSGANLKEANLEGAYLSEADLTKANLTGANLSRANLSDAKLIGANLSRANLTEADLSRANLTEADLLRANLLDANLIGANLSRANLTEADLSGANFYICENLTKEQLHSAINWDNAIRIPQELL